MTLLTYQNSKLKHQLIFNLPVSHAICGRQCAGCYALKAQRRFPSVLASCERKYQASLLPTFASTIISEIANFKRPLTAVRLHSSGEFHSQAYIDQWVTIASALPHIKFYAFTKRLSDFDFSKLSALPNFVLINSLQFGGLNYAPVGKLPSSAFICPVTQHKPVQCGTSCTYCMSKVAQTNGVCFVKH